MFIIPKEDKELKQKLIDWAMRNMDNRLIAQLYIDGMFNTQRYMVAQCLFHKDEDIQNMIPLKIWKSPQRFKQSYRSSPTYSFECDNCGKFNVTDFVKKIEKIDDFQACVMLMRKFKLKMHEFSVQVYKDRLGVDLGF